MVYKSPRLLVDIVDRRPSATSFLSSSIFSPLSILVGLLQYSSHAIASSSFIPPDFNQTKDSSDPMLLWGWRQSAFQRVSSGMLPTTVWNIEFLTTICANSQYCVQTCRVGMGCRKEIWEKLWQHIWEEEEERRIAKRRRNADRHCRDR